MILRFHAAVRAALTDTLLRIYALEPAAIPSIVLEAPPTRAMGDLACPVAFELARRLRKAPRAIAAEIVAALGPIPGISQAVAAPNGYINVFLDRAAAVRLALGVDRRRRAGARAAAAGREDDRRAHGDQPEQGRPHRPPAQLHAGRHARPAAALRRRAGRGPELHRRHRRPGRRRRGRLRASRAQDARRGARDRRLDALRLLLLGPLRPRHRVVRRGSRAPVGAQRDAARHRARRQRHRGARRLHRRSHRPGAPRDDGAAERRLRPPDVGGRHPAPEVLGHRLRPAARERHDVQADRGQARRLLGDADRRGGRRHAGRRSRAEAAAAEAEARGRGRGHRAAREGDRPIGRHRHLRRQGHRLPVPGSSACSGRTSTTGRSRRASPATRCGRRRRRRAAIGRIGRPSAAPMPSTT